MTSAMAASISVLMVRYWAWRSTKGIFTGVIRGSSIVVRAQRPGGIARVIAGFGYVFGHHGPGADDDVITDPHGQNRRIGADGNMVANVSFLPKGFVSASRTALLEQIIDEHHPMRNHSVISDGYQFTNKGVRLNLAAFANLYPFLNFDERSNEATLADGAAIEIDRLSDFDVLTKQDINNAVTANGWYCHESSE